MLEKTDYSSKIQGQEASPWLLIEMKVGEKVGEVGSGEGGEQNGIKLSYFLTFSFPPNTLFAINAPLCGVVVNNLCF